MILNKQNDILNNQNIIMQDLFLIKNSQKASQDTGSQKLIEKKDNTHTFQSSSLPPPPPTSSDPPPSVGPSSAKTVPRGPRKKVNIAFVGDSIAHNIDTLKVEKATRSIITKKKAYGAKQDNVSFFPSKNFTNIVPELLAKKVKETNMNYDVLLLQASSTDITNLDTSNHTEENMENLKQKAMASSENIFNVAIQAVKSTDIPKVIIMERIPRHDRSQDDPAGIKPRLSELANFHLRQLLLQSELKHRIMIGSHSIFGSLGICDLYGGGDNFDGIHLLGPAGKHTYTQSVIRILSDIGLTCSKDSYPLFQEVQFKCQVLQ